MELKKRENIGWIDLLRVLCLFLRCFFCTAAMRSSGNLTPIGSRF